jgi:thiol:disulfide interchange protein DsbC
MQKISKLLFLGLVSTAVLSFQVSSAASLKKENLKTQAPVKITASGPLSVEEIKQLLQAKFPSASINHIAPSEVKGLYSFMLQGDLYYISDNGKYLLKGQMLDISTPKVRNVSSERIADIQKQESPMRMAEIEKLSEEQMVVYKAPQEKHVVTIFTDVDCGFCQKLHRERQDYLDLGITLRYLAFPRAGLDSKSAAKLEGIWCANDQQLAMTEAKIEHKYRTGNCKTPFKEHMALVRKFGLNGTPGIILENGDLIGGYLPAEVLNRRLNEAQEPEVANR